MRTVITVALGIWIGSRVYKTLAENQVRERELAIRKELERFIMENLPGKFTARQMKQEVEQIIKAK